jgi:hypothetical protein
MIWSCGSGGSSQEIGDSMLVTSEDLIQFNQRKLVAQESLLDSLAARWGWPDASEYIVLGSGLRVVMLESASGIEVSQSKDDSVRWHVDVRLVDSTRVMGWQAQDPLVFHRKRSGWPSGFQELAEQLNIGDSADVLMPAHMAWGLTGWSPHVPQDAALLLHIRVLSDDLLFMSTEDQTNWLQVISDFESGTFRPDSQWCAQPILLGSPCLAWGDLRTQDPAVGVSMGTSVSMRMRTQVRRDQRIVDDLGWRSWQYEWGDEEQCLPVIEDLMTADLRFKRWECWCPAEKAFGSLGFPEAGIHTGDVVGFQWELSKVPAKASI